MSFEVRWTETAIKQIKKIDKSAQERIFEKILSISENPFPHIKRLKGFNLYSLRAGDYRIIMSIENKLMVIFILDVGHRSKIYRKY